MRKIPAEFQLGACTWKVVWSDTLLERENCYGQTSYNTNTIYLQRPIRGKYSMQNVRQVFWHEFVHAALFTINRIKLAKDEVLVDQLGHMIAQFVLSKH